MKRSLYVNRLGDLLHDSRLPEDERKRRRSFSPVASKVRVIHSPGPDATHGPDPFDHWMRETMSRPVKVIGDDKGVVKHWLMTPEVRRALAEPYDIDAMKAVQERGGLKQLIKLMCPSLSAERQAMLYERISSLCHAKQRQHELEARPALIVGDKEHRARRLTKREKRERREGKGKRLLK